MPQVPEEALDLNFIGLSAPAIGVLIRTRPLECRKWAAFGCRRGPGRPWIDEECRKLVLLRLPHASEGVAGQPRPVLGLDNDRQSQARVAPRGKKLKVLGLNLLSRAT
jgi:hypothetical protein